MKKIILLILILILLTSCTMCNVDNFVIPNDIQFIECIDKLDTVQLIAQYMEDNFTYKEHFLVYTPYEMWEHKIGDCTDYGAFGAFAAEYNGIEAYQVVIWYKNENSHTNTVYKVWNYWYLTDSWVLHGVFTDIDQAIKWHSEYSDRILVKYKILGGK